MTPAAAARGNSSVAWTLSSGESVRWREKGMTFEITSPSSSILDMARRVFDAGFPVAKGNPDRSWHIEQAPASAPAGAQWLVTRRSPGAPSIQIRTSPAESTVLHVEHDLIDFLVRAPGDSIAVHAALLTKHDRGLMIVGPSFAGKSTLATALWRAGWSLLADDVVFLEPATCAAVPATRRVSLRFESRHFVGDSMWARIRRSPSCIETGKGLFFHPHEVSGESRRKEARVDGIFFLARREVRTPPAESRRINPAHATLALIPYAFNVRELPLGESLRLVSPLAATVPSFDIGRGDLRRMTDAVEKCIG